MPGIQKTGLQRKVINVKIVIQDAVGSRMAAGLHIVANVQPDLMWPCGGNECQKDWLDYKSKRFPIGNRK